MHTILYVGCLANPIPTYLLVLLKIYNLFPMLDYVLLLMVEWSSIRASIKINVGSINP